MSVLVTKFHLLRKTQLLRLYSVAGYFNPKVFVNCLQESGRYAVYRDLRVKTTATEITLTVLYCSASEIRY